MNLREILLVAVIIIVFILIIWMSGTGFREIFKKNGHE